MSWEYYNIVGCMITLERARPLADSETGRRQLISVRLLLQLVFLSQRSLKWPNGLLPVDQFYLYPITQIWVVRRYWLIFYNSSFDITTSVNHRFILMFSDAGKLSRLSTSYIFTSVLFQKRGKREADEETPVNSFYNISDSWN